MRTRRIPWRDAMRPQAGPSRNSAPRWRGQLVGGLLVLVALGLIYHSQESQQILRQLGSYFTGTPAVTQTLAPASAGPADAQSLTQELSTVASSAKTQDWQLAGDELRAAEASWARLEESYGKAGIASTDMNGFTADLANLALAISEKNAAQVAASVQNAQKTLAWMTTNYVAGSGPTFQEMSSLVSDLNKAATQQNWAEVQKDAQMLQKMMQSIQQGF
ncbi:MAG: hypothetical protein M0Z66_03495 [Thermaerobacter sp.]|nr:hypothetical protein [Thermaerobacter sp.]